MNSSKKCSASRSGINNGYRIKDAIIIIGEPTYFDSEAVRQTLDESIGLK